MRLFLVIYFLVYGGLHLHAFLKAKAALAFGVAVGIPLALFMLTMILAPIVVRYSERFGLDLFARIMANIGFVWGGILFLFFSASIVLDLYRLVIYVFGLIFQADTSSFVPSARHSFYAPLFLSVSIFVYGYYEANSIRTERLAIKSHKIPAENSPLKIVQISDVHLGLIVREGRLNRILDKVRSEHPDILVSTGDLVDGQICKLNGLEDLLREIRPRYGKFAVTGNHEFYAGFDNARCFTENAGFTLLRGQATSVAGITIAGVDDPVGRMSGLAKDISEKELLLPLSREKFILFLKHRPLLDENAVGLFDLQLSGHIHKGQIFPFTLITSLYYRITSGRLELPNNTLMYVSRGSGTWGPPIRFLAPPEVTVIELIHGN
ncbi:MAG TPA: metallophosphoesterase [Thermodesulfovibrionales bacterium]|nr:metallophosphoesterase [Thermodesulfovibrionales bacterium]